MIRSYWTCYSKARLYDTTLVLRQRVGGFPAKRDIKHLIVFVVLDAL